LPVPVLYALAFLISIVVGLAGGSIEEVFLLFLVLGCTELGVLVIMMARGAGKEAARGAHSWGPVSLRAAEESLTPRERPTEENPALGAERSSWPLYPHYEKPETEDFRRGKRMKQRTMLAVFMVGVFWILLSTLCAAQQVLDLTDHAETDKELREGLEPQEEPPSSFQMKGQSRGIGPGSVAKPRCEHYWQQLTGSGPSRGIAMTESMKAIALHLPFPVNSYRLTPEVEQRLDTLGTVLGSGKLSTCCFQIAGHTDSTGGNNYNLQLSKRRAESVRRYLALHFDLQDRTISVGYGEAQPIADDHTAEGRQKNRRVEVVTLGYGQP
jgi:outer membrane protein OmpA-like peptidoglycan-associated protein